MIVHVKHAEILQVQVVEAVDQMLHEKLEHVHVIMDSTEISQNQAVFHVIHHAIYAQAHHQMIVFA